MSAQTRAKNVEWTAMNADGSCPGVDHANLAVLMDIRDELKRLNSLLGCPNFIRIPHTLERLRLLDPIARMARRANTNAAKRRKARA